MFQAVGWVLDVNKESDLKYTAEYTHNGKTPVSKEVSICKASITIRADDKTAEKGSPLPELTYTVTGLAGADSLAAVPILTCDADMDTTGTYPITADSAEVPDTGNYEEAIVYESGILTVLDPVVHVTGVLLDRGSLALSVGSTGRLTAAVAPGDATDKGVSWASSAPAVASVDNSGNITAASAGTAVITVTTADGGHTASCTVTVTVTGADSGSLGSGSGGSPGSAQGGGSTGGSVKKPFIKDSSGREGWDVIRAEAEKAAAAPEGGMVGDHAGAYVNLFYHDPVLRSLEFICAGQIGEDGIVHLPFVHASDYIVILSAYPMGGADLSGDSFEPQDGTGPEDPQGPGEDIHAQVGSVALSKTVYTYNGKAKKPSVIAVDTDGRRIPDSHYTVAYRDNIKVGRATAEVTFKDGYSGTVKKTFKIRPVGTSIKKLTAVSGGFSVKWVKKTAQADGYQIQYAADAGFKKKSTHSVSVKKASVTKKTVKGLKAGKRYHVRIRTYKTVKAGGKSTRIYSAWSKAVRVRTLS